MTLGVMSPATLGIQPIILTNSWASLDTIRLCKRIRRKMAQIGIYMATTNLLTRYSSWMLVILVHSEQPTAPRCMVMKSFRSCCFLRRG